MVSHKILTLCTTTIHTRLVLPVELHCVFVCVCIYACVCMYIHVLLCGMCICVTYLCVCVYDNQIKLLALFW